MNGLSNRTRSGFTLIELLVVIAIIAILAAILFPVFARARENARRSSCQSNLKQMGLGFMQYTQDYDERYPGFAGWGGAGGWIPMVNPYIKSTDVLRCPSVKTTDTTTYGLNSFTGCAPVSGYVNPGAVIRGGTNCQGSGLLLSAVGLPAQTILVYEGTNAYNPTTGAWNVYNNGADFTGVGCPSGAAFQACYWGEDMPAARSRHLLGENFAFCDGHVKWYPEAKLLTLGNGTIAFAGHKNGTGPGSNQYNTYKHNGDIDMQYAVSTQWDP